MTHENNNNKDFGRGVLTGIMLAAAAAAGYLFYGPKAEENRRKFKEWKEKFEEKGREKKEEIKDKTDKARRKIAKKLDPDEDDKTLEEELEEMK